MSNFYEETKGLLQKIEENTRDGNNGGGNPGGGGSTEGLTNTELRQAPVNVNVSSFATKNLTPSYAVVTTSGSITAGAQSVAFYNNGPNSVTVAGGILAAKHGVSFDAGNFQLGAISYSIPSGTSLQISQIK